MTTRSIPAPAAAALARPRGAPWRPDLRGWALFAGAWAAVGLLFWAVTAAFQPQFALVSGALRLSWVALWLVVTAAVHALRGVLRGRPAAVRVAAHAAAFVASALADSAVRRAVVVLLGERVVVPFFTSVLFYLDMAILSFAAAMLLAIVRDTQRELLAQQRRELALRADRARAQLAQLEARFHPHFLFNALTSVIEQLHDEPAGAARSLRGLAEVVRANGGERRLYVSLREELATALRYLELQRMRFSDWLTITHEVDPAARDAVVVPFVLQPLFENALRHGLSGRTAAGTIHFDARVRDGRLVLSVRDNGVGLGAAAPANARRGWGIGLTQVRERLALGYGEGGYEFALEEHPEGGTAATAVLPLRPPTADDADAPGAGEWTAADDDAPARTPWIDRVHPVALVVGGWLLWGAVWMQNSIAYLAYRGRLREGEIGYLFRSHLVAVLLWTLLTPIVLIVARLAPMRRGRVAVAAAAHLAGALAFALLHSAGWALSTTGSLERWPATQQSIITLNVVLYGIVLALLQRRRLRDWLRERRLATAALAAEQAEQPLRAATAELRPLEVADRLDALADVAEREPRKVERALQALADELRRVLDAASDHLTRRETA